MLKKTSDLISAPEEDTERECQLLNDHPRLVTKELDLEKMIIVGFFLQIFVIVSNMCNSCNSFKYLQ